MMKYNKLISIIIPCYNCEEYLSKMFDSLINQTVKNFEVIFVNDGSTDNSLDLAKQILSKSNLQYRIINQKNQGVSIARNNAIKEATGKYIYFLDSDDCIDINFCKHISNLYENEEFDICFFDYAIKHNDKIEYKINKYIGKLPTEQVLRDVLNEKLFYHMCSFIIKRDLINKSLITFREGCKYGEDHEFIIKCIINCRDEVLFYYIMREDSAVHRFNINRLDSINAALRIEEYILNYINDKEIKFYVKKYIANKMLYNIKVFIEINNVNKISKGVKKTFLNKIRENKKYFNYLDYNELLISKKGIIKKMIQININIYIYIYYIRTKYFVKG